LNCAQRTKVVVAALLELLYTCTNDGRTMDLSARPMPSTNDANSDSHFTMHPAMEWGKPTNKQALSSRRVMGGPSAPEVIRSVTHSPMPSALSMSKHRILVRPCSYDPIVNRNEQQLDPSVCYANILEPQSGPTTTEAVLAWNVHALLVHASTSTAPPPSFPTMGPVNRTAKAEPPTAAQRAGYS